MNPGHVPEPLLGELGYRTAIAILGSPSENDGKEWHRLAVLEDRIVHAHAPHAVWCAGVPLVDYHRIMGR